LFHFLRWFQNCFYFFSSINIQLTKRIRALMSCAQMSRLRLMVFRMKNIIDNNKNNTNWFKMKCTPSPKFRIGKRLVIDRKSFKNYINNFLHACYKFELFLSLTNCKNKFTHQFAENTCIKSCINVKFTILTPSCVSNWYKFKKLVIDINVLGRLTFCYIISMYCLSIVLYGHIIRKSRSTKLDNMHTWVALVTFWIFNVVIVIS